MVYYILIKVNFPISIIIPIFDEEKRLERGLDRTLQYCIASNWDFEVIVVEDGSTDSSVEIVKKYALQDNRVKLVSLDKRYGKGGFLLKAIHHCNKDNIGFMDIDLSTDPSEFERLMQYSEEFDIIIGSRILRGDLGPIKRPTYRSFLSFMYSLLFKCLFNVKIFDLQCGFKLFNRDSILQIISTVKTNGFAFDTEFLVKSYLHGLKIKEVPINWHHDFGSKLDIIKTVCNMFNDLVAIWLDVIKIQTTERSLHKDCFLARPIMFSRFLASKNDILKSMLKTKQSRLVLSKPGTE